MFEGPFLTRLLPEQASSAWPILAPRLAETYLGPGEVSPQVMTNMLSAIMLERVDCWVRVDKEGAPKIILITYLQNEIATGILHFVVSHLWADGMLSRKDVRLAVDQLSEFGRSLGAMFLLGITGTSSIASLSQAYGARVASIIEIKL